MWTAAYFLILFAVFAFSDAASHMRKPNDEYDFWPVNPNATLVPDAGEIMYQRGRVRIGYVLDSMYPLTEYTTLVSAMNHIKTATKGCIEFLPYDLIAGTLPLSRLHFRNQPISGSINACRTHPGYVRNSSGAGQQALFFGSRSKGTSTAEHGCLDDERETTRFLMKMLGVVSEFQRPDRSAVGMNFGTGYNNKTKTYLRNEFLFFPEQTAHTHKLLDMVDLESVTMITPEQFAASESDPVFTFANGMSLMRSISGKLSLADCEALNYMYQCGITCGSILSEITMEPATRVVNMHCWTAQQAGKPISATDEMQKMGEIGRIGVLSVLDSDVRYTFGSSNLRLKIRTQTYNNPPDTRKSVAVGLFQTISKGFQTTFTVDARAGTGIVATGSIEAWINCWPQFRIQDRLVSCQTETDDGFPLSLGMRDASICLDRDGDEIRVPCTLEDVLSWNTEVFRVHVIDPDESPTQSELIRVSTINDNEDETSNETPEWIYNNVTGVVRRRVNNLEDVSGAIRLFRILFKDTTYASNVNPDGSIILETLVTLSCKKDE